MQPFRVYILGCGSALPTPKHMATSQVVEVRLQPLTRCVHLASAW